MGGEPRTKSYRLILFSIIAVAILVGFISWRPLLVRHRLNQAAFAFEAKDFSLALEHLNSALELDLQNPQTQFLFARVNRRLGRLEEMDHYLAKAEDLGFDATRLQRERILAQAQTGQLKKAEPHLGRLLQDPQGDVQQICEAYANGYFANYRINEAFQIIEAWEKDFPKDPQPHFMRAFVFQAISDTENAIDEYHRGLELSPFRTNMRLQLANSLSALRQYEKAEEHYRRCGKEDGTNPNVLAGLARCLFNQGKIEAALGFLARSSKAAPGHLETIRLQGEIALAEGRFKDAANAFGKITAKTPYDSPAHYSLGKALQALGEKEKARPHFDYVAEAEEPLNKMEKDLDRLSKTPYDPQLRYEIGAVLLKYGAPDDAAKWLNTALELDPNHKKTHQALARYYSMIGNLETAARHLALAGKSSAE